MRFSSLYTSDNCCAIKYYNELHESTYPFLFLRNKVGHKRSHAVSVVCFCADLLTQNGTNVMPLGTVVVNTDMLSF